MPPHTYQNPGCQEAHVREPRILRGTDFFLADLGLERSGPRPCQWGNDPDSKIRRANLTHAVMSRMLEEAESLAPFLKLSRDVVFGFLCDLVIEEAERSPYGLVAIEEGGESAREQASPGSLRFQELLAIAERMAGSRREPPRAPEWAVSLDRGDSPDRSRR